MLSRRKLRVAFAGALTTTIAAAMGLSGAEYLWVGPKSGYWSDPSKWSGNNVPPTAGSASTELRFAGAGGDVAATYDQYASYTANRVSFDYYGSGTFTVNSFGGQPLAFAGTAPALVQNGNGQVNISGLSLPTTGSLMISGAGSGDLILGGVLSTTGGNGSLVIAGGVASPRAQQIVSDSQLSVQGGIRLASGNLRVGAADQLGTDTLTVAGGTLGSAGAGKVTIANSIALESRLDFIGIRNGLFTGPISSATAGTGAIFRLLPGKTVTLTAASTYTGPTVIDYAPVVDGGVSPYTGAGTLALDSSGSLLNSSQYEVRAGGNLSLNAQSATSDRLADAAPVLLRGGQFTFVNFIDRFATTETIGPLTVAGHSTVAIASTGLSSTAVLKIASLGRVGRGTVLFRGSALGENGASTISFAQAPTGLVGGGGTGPNTSILPYALGDSSTSGNGSSFVTYDPVTGIRPLKLDVEYASSVAGAAPTNNVRLGTSETLSTSATINSLNLGSGALTLSGPGQLTVTSGAILSSYGGTIGTPVAFGAAEAVLFTPGNLTMTGNLTGTGGLTKAGAGTLDLQGQNSGLTGPLSINGGVLSFRNGSALPGTGAISFEGVNAGLDYLGVGPSTVSRGIVVPSGFVTLGSDTPGTLLIQGVISGAGGLRAANSLLLNQHNNAGTLRLSAGNTYTGPTHLSNGRLEIPDDSALGSGDYLAFDGVGTLGLLGAWSTSRELYLPGSGTIDTNAFSASVSGLVTGTGALVKTGAGTLDFSASSPWTGMLAVNGGTLRLSGQGQLRSPSYAVSGAELQLDNTAAALSRLTDNATVALNSGALSLLGHPTARVVEKIATVTASGGLSVIALTPNGSAGTTLAMDSLTLTSGDLLVRAPGLGGNGRVTATVYPAAQGGLLSRIYASGSSTGGESWGVYDATVDSAGAVGIKPFTGYATPTVLAAPLAAEVLLTGNVSAAGASAPVQSLTLEAGSQLTLTSGQTVSVTSGRMLTRSGGSATVSGGTLDFGAAAVPFIQAFGDLTIDAKITGANAWSKRGPGTLTLGTQSATSAEINVEMGTLSALATNSLAAKIITLGASGTFAAGSGLVQLGGATGTGVLTLAGGTLELGTAPRDFAFNGNLTGTGTLKIVGGGNSTAVRTFYQNSKAFAGQVVLESGIVAFFNATAFGTGPITLAGAGLQSPNLSNEADIAQPLLLQGDLSVQGGSVKLQAGATVTGAGGVRVDHGGLVVEVPTAFAGSTVVNSGLTLQAAGTLPSSVIRVGPGGALNISESSANAARGARLPDSGTVALDGGSLSIISANPVSLVEKIGALQVSGASSLSFYNNSFGLASSVGLRADSVTRSPGATLSVYGQALGDPTATVNTRILIDAAPAMVGGGGTGADTSIIPWLAGQLYSSGPADRLVTYSPANGLRLLTNAEMASSPTAVTAATNNLRIAQAYVVNAPLSINSLTIDTSADFTSTNLTGTGKIILGSGVIMHRGTSLDQIANPVDFGSAEGIVSVTGGALNLAGAVSGSAGLTKAGSADLRLSGANTFTGPLTVNGGAVRFTSTASLGAGTAAIRLQGTPNQTASLLYDGAGSAVLSRDVVLTGNGNYLSNATAGTTLDIRGAISGAGRLVYQGDGQFSVLGTQTYTGGTNIFGNVLIGSDASLGAASGPLTLTGGSLQGLRIAGPWTSNRAITIANDYAIVDTNGFDAVWNGPLQAPNSLQKQGAGTLSIAGVSNYTSTLAVAGGTLRLAGQAEFAATYVDVLSNARLLLDESGLVSGKRLSSTGTLLGRPGGELILQGNASVPVVETVGVLTSGPLITLKSAGPALTLSAASWTVNSIGPTPFGTIRGDGLGGATRIIFRTPPTLRGGLLPATFALESATGSQPTFAVYDSAVDALGTVGVRPMRSSDYATGTTLRDLNHGGATPNLANALLTGTQTAAGGTLALNSVTVAGQATLQAASGQVVRVDTGWFLTPAGSSLTVTGGYLQLPTGESAGLFGTGTVALRSDAVFGSLSQPENSSFTLGARKLGGFVQYAGAAQLGEGGPLNVATVSNYGGSALDINSSNASIGYLSTQLVAIGVTGNLTIGQLPNGGTFDLHGGTLTFVDASAIPEVDGTGTVKSLLAATTYGLSVKGDFTGPLIGEGGSFTLSALSTLPNITRAEVHGALLQIGSFAVIPQNLPLVMSGGRLEVSATSATAGPLTVSGSTQLAAMAAVAVDFASLKRASTGGTLLVDGSYPALGNAPGAGGSNLRFRTALTPDLVSASPGTVVPILPYAVVQTEYTPAYRLATYDAANGLRPLQLTEYASTLQAGANVRLTASAVLTAPVSFNALQLSANSTLSGNFTAGLTSGVLLGENGGTVAAGTTLDFGSRTGFVYGLGSIYSILNLQGTLTGSGGLSFNGNSRIQLAGTNNVTGPIALNSGTVAFANPAALGGSGVAVLFDATVEFSGVNLARAFSVQGQRGTIKGSAAGATLLGVVSGSGNVVFDSIAVTGANTYTGTTELQGAVSLGGAKPLGDTSAIVLGFTTVQLLAPLATDKPVSFTTNAIAAIDTNGFAATLSGPLTGYATLTKTGAGRLTLNQTENFNGNVTVAAGTLALEGVASLSSDLTVGAQGTLAGGGQLFSSVVVNGTLDPGTDVGTLGVKNVTFKDGSTFKLKLASANSYDSLDAGGTVTLNGVVNLQLELLFDPVDKVDLLTLLLNDGADAVAGTGAFWYGGQQLTEGARFFVGTQEFALTYHGGDGNDVVIAAVPEPASVGYLAIGTLPLGIRCRRKPAGQKI